MSPAELSPPGRIAVQRTKPDADGMKSNQLHMQPAAAAVGTPGLSHSTAPAQMGRLWSLSDDAPARLDGLEVSESSFDDWAAVLAELDGATSQR